MFNQGVARTLHGPLPAETAQHPANERRLARAELARQRDDHAAAQPARERRAGGDRGRRIGEMAMRRFYNDSLAG